jgi:hypothetical protein
MIDEDGVGGGVVDGMMGVRGFVANSSPIPTANEIRSRIRKIDSFLIPKANFKNLKSQCAWKVAELINEHKIAFKVPEWREQIVEELTALLKNNKPDSDGKLQIVPKDDVKAEIGHSPDIGEPIIYRAWFELKKEAKEEDPIKESQITNKMMSQFNRNRTSNNSTK